MKDKLIFYIINIAIYPLITFVIMPCLVRLQTFDGGDAAGNAMGRAFTYLFGCVVAFVIVLIVSSIISYKWLHCVWHAVPALALGAFLIWFLPEAESYIESNRTCHYKEYYASGQLREEGVKIGKHAYSKHGIITYYTEDGRIDRTETWKKGEMNGEYCEYYDNGKLAAKGIKIYCFLHGEYDSYRFGKWLFYRENGTLDDERTYDEGIISGSKNYKLCWLKSQNGKYIVCDIRSHQPITGELDKTAIVDNDVIPFYYTGKIIDGKFDGAWSGYYDSSGLQMSAEGTAVMGKNEGRYTAYYPNGQVYVTACYQDDKLEGEYYSYNKESVVTATHGTCKYSCHYVDGKRHGIARWWNEDGVLVRESEYDTGESDGASREYYDNGELKSEYIYRNSQKEGPYERYYESGALQEEGCYKNNKKVYYKSYYENGMLEELLLEGNDPVHYDRDTYVQAVYSLKNGYELRISLSPDSIHVFTLKQDDKWCVMEKDPYCGYDKEKFALRYSGIDFDDYLVLDRWESQYSVYLYLYEKSTGKNLFKDKLYLESGYDSSANLLLYLDTDDKTNPKGNLTLLNLQNLSAMEVDVRRFIPEDILPNYYWNDFSVKKVNNTSVCITYDGEKSKQISELLLD